MNCALSMRAGPVPNQLRGDIHRSSRCPADRRWLRPVPVLRRRVDSSSVTNEIDPTVEIIAYQNRYHCLPHGQSMLVDEEAQDAAVLHRRGSPDR